MNEQEREKIDFLIHGFLDGELTQRQRTELKRLVHHDPSIKKELHGLYRQKELLAALPSERAPKELLEGVRSNLERQMILGSEASEEIRSVGHTHLLLRRIAAVAAMLLLPLGILTILVIQIMKPAPGLHPANTPVTELDTSGEMALLETKAEPGSRIQEIPLVLGRLTLTTDEPIAVNKAIQTIVVSHELLSEVSSVRGENHAVYRIQCSQRQLLSLSRNLAAVWPNCSNQQLALAVDDPTSPKKVLIEGISPEQLNTLIEEPNPIRMQMIAAYMERLNKIDPSDYLRSIKQEGDDASRDSGEVVLQPVQPKIAWPEEHPDLKRTAAKPEQDESADGPQVIIEIEVKSSIRDS